MIDILLNDRTSATADVQIDSYHNCTKSYTHCIVCEHIKVLIQADHANKKHLTQSRFKIFVCIFCI